MEFSKVETSDERRGTRVNDSVASHESFIENAENNRMLQSTESNQTDENEEE